MFEQTIQISQRDGQLRALLYAKNAVLSENTEEDGSITLQIRLEQDEFKKMLSRAGIPQERYIPQVKEFWQK